MYRERRSRLRGQMVAVEMDVSRNKQIQAPIAVIVAPRSAGRPIPQLHAGFFRDIGKRPVVVVVVQAVLAPVGHVNIRPAVIVIVCNGHADAPAVVGYAGLRCHIRKGAVVIVMEQRRMGWRLLAIQRIEGRAIHHVNIEPAVVVVVDQANAPAFGLDNVFLLRGPHLVGPMGQSGLLRYVFEDHGPALHKAARGDGPMLRVELGWLRRAAAHAARRRCLGGHGRRLSLLS